MDQERATLDGLSSQMNESYNVSVNETVVDIRSDENVENTSMKVKNVEEEAYSSSTVNNGKLGDVSNQRLCRICHLCALESGKTLVDLTEIGCGCIGELGFAHPHCAEAWFKIKGNRICEICGEIAKNIKGSVENRFMEEWNEDEGEVNYDFESHENDRGCRHGHPLCNLLLACSVIVCFLGFFVFFQ